MEKYAVQDIFPVKLLVKLDIALFSCDTKTRFLIKMIIYQTKVGERELNAQAIELREKYKRLLKGIYCHVCAKDSMITWDKNNNMTPIINACCKDFEKKLIESLKIK